VGARSKLALLATRIHAADAGDDPRVSIVVKPCEFALDLQGEFARRRDDQGKRRGSALEPLGLAEKIPRDCESVGDGLARAGLGRNE
jgi:hypothetical protein